ncbi:hypothetical protein CIL05_10655 [Virgibacillus profundi]|uniref:Flagellar protein n=1 Tax=Virgibacillus profundi TaxID=2024555 RepID=A0A2A2IET3_9BACI|nr:hypothetical protein [Virgibacillus profundi]PAV29816.1 hypothetical protein CIL05_10655 [Virgibacillus profundi]PXY53987.1 hypothetical protein CIT14_10755 [Virgibacillus profundi]
MGEIVRNCRLCKVPMESSPFPMCENCLKERDRVRSFITKNQFASVEEISLSTNVPREKVEKMAKLGVNPKSDLETNIH